MRNPIATEEQARFEREALAVLHHPRMQAAIAEQRTAWPALTKPSADQLRAFEWAFDEVVFGAIIWSLNTDPERPAVVTISRIPHDLDGERIPGSRWGLDNPDSIYRVIPIGGTASYVIRGRVREKRLTENYFTLWNANRGTVDVLDGKTLVLDDEGRFEIAVDAEPKGDRANHVRSSPEAVEFYIRDVVTDWATETPNELSIERLGPPPQTPERTLDEKVDRAAAFMRSIMTDSTRWNRQATDKAPNDFDFTIDRDTDGALRNQIYIMGHFKLADDEALVIDIGLGGADYFLAPITNWWGTTNEIVHRCGSRNIAQSERNADGDSLTYVVSKRDPGVVNWIDPCDMGDGIMTLRWAEFADGRPGEGFGAKGRVVKFDALAEALPPGTRRITPEERRAELEARAAAYLRRVEP